MHWSQMLLEQVMMLNHRIVEVRRNLEIKFKHSAKAGSPKADNNILCIECIPFQKENGNVLLSFALTCTASWRQEVFYSLLVITRPFGLFLGESGAEEIACCFCWGWSAVPLWTDGSWEKSAHPRKWGSGPEFIPVIGAIGAHVHTVWCVEKQIPGKQVVHPTELKQHLSLSHFSWVHLLHCLAMCLHVQRADTTVLTPTMKAEHTEKVTKKVSSL